MKYLASLLVLLALIGCGGGSGGGGNGAGDDGVEEFVYQEATDKSQCEGQTQFNSPLRSWHYDLKGSGKKTGRTATMRIRFNFLQSTAEMSNECLIAGRYGYAGINVPIKVDETARVIRILEDRQVIIDSNGVRCGVIVKSATLKYELVGRCMKASSENGVQFLVAD